MKFLDDHVANPAYLLVLVTRVTMAWWHRSFTIHWIQAATVPRCDHAALWPGIAVMVPILAILFLMVTKPSL